MADFFPAVPTEAGRQRPSTHERARSRSTSCVRRRGDRGPHVSDHIVTRARGKQGDSRVLQGT
jgi:hypothetical protein